MDPNTVMNYLYTSLNKRTWQYSKEENGLVGRENKDAYRILGSICFDRDVKDSWSAYSSLIMKLYNSSIKSLGVFKIN